MKSLFNDGLFIGHLVMNNCIPEALEFLEFINESLKDKEDRMSILRLT